MTPHIEAQVGEIAKTVIMPGDPMRAKFIAENYLTDYKLVNQVRGILAYTGTYQGKEVTVMASGMGMPSMGIYSYELYNFYNVENIIRIGSCGTYKEFINVFDIIIVDGSYSETTYDKQSHNQNINIVYASKDLNERILNTAKQNNIKTRVENIECSDAFYNEKDTKEAIKKFGCVGVEMESFALFYNAKQLNKKAACILTVSDNLVTKQEISSEEREKSLTEMIELALKSIE